MRPFLPEPRAHTSGRMLSTAFSPSEKADYPPALSWPGPSMGMLSTAFSPSEKADYPPALSWPGPSMGMPSTAFSPSEKADYPRHWSRRERKTRTL